MSIVLSHHGNLESAAAFDLAAHVAQVEGERLVVVIAASIAEGGASAGAELEDRLWGRLEELGILFEVRRARAGVAVSESILEVAREVGASLVVLGLRPGGSRGTTLGPNATRILLDAPCPVLTTTPDARDVTSFS